MGTRNPRFWFVAVLWAGGCLFGQVVPSAIPVPVPKKAADLQGIVIADDTGRPLRRALVLLKGMDSSARAYSDTTDERGHFSLPSVEPGTYTILAQREGYLPAYSGRVGGTRLPPIFTIPDGANWNDLNVRLQRAGVIAGRVLFDDGEPAINVAVQAYRESYFRGLHAYSVAGNGSTNDRGEYRLNGLPAGKYFVAALYGRAAPDPSVRQTEHRDPSGLPKPERRYAITFYRSVTRLMDASPVKLARGTEVGVVDILLSPVATVRVRGTVISGISGKQMKSSGIVLRRVDSTDGSSVAAPVDQSEDRERRFVLSGLVPGPYYFVLNDSDEGIPVTARQLVAVGEAGVDGLTIVLKPPAVWNGFLSVAGESSADLASFQVRLEPRRDTAAAVKARVDDSGRFRVSIIPGETYDLTVEGGPPELYLRSVRLGNADLLATGVKAEGSDTSVPLRVQMGTDGGAVIGVALTPEQTVAAGSTVQLIPDPPRGRVADFKTVYADQNGSFVFPGVTPGRYVAVAWLDEPPCEIYDPEDLAECRRIGAPVDVTPSGRSSVELRSVR